MMRHQRAESKLVVGTAAAALVPKNFRRLVFIVSSSSKVGCSRWGAPRFIAHSP